MIMKYLCVLVFGALLIANTNAFQIQQGASKRTRLTSLKMEISKKEESGIDRRTFITDVAVLGTALVALPVNPIKGSIIAGAAPASVFSGEYSDPNHPGMKRSIEAVGSKIVIKGSDDGLNVWELTAVPKGESVLIDFSPKGGPKDLLGKWDGSGIVFPDGNKWSKITPNTFVGDYADPNHPGMPRKISLGAKGALTIKGSDDGEAFWELAGTVSGPNVLIDFSPKGGPKDLVGKWDGSGIIFPDGNKWSIITKATYVGDYSDPKHPGSPRKIAVDPATGGVDVTGDDGRGPWALRAAVDGPFILVDFSPKGGPKNLMGHWVGDGIAWPDGNKWTIKN